MQNVVKLPPLIKPCIIFGVNFWFMMGKSRRVPSCTQGFIPIVVDSIVYHGYARTASVLSWMRSEPWAGISY